MSNEHIKRSGPPMPFPVGRHDGDKIHVGAAPVGLFIWREDSQTWIQDGWTKACSPGAFHGDWHYISDCENGDDDLCSYDPEARDVGLSAEVVELAHFRRAAVAWELVEALEWGLEDARKRAKRLTTWALHPEERP